ncbi:MAG: 2-oxoacid:ferredoxin oxidoreductase subunit beta [Candidatus Omnitrophica bacterium]|nr:2-oxoacid:ferredoxin oxidoreductase subunit beta [Candidatus Omnitrophota bacterium]
MTTNPAEAPTQLPYKKSDFESGQEVRWCPGCGDYAILATMQRTLAKFNKPKEKYVFISGIGCSSRFPYYMNTYGFHTIHGRAPTIATGLRCTNPDLSIWVVTGDGDGLSIGGNHLIHCMRRNVNLNILLVNNRIYGLTKGQYSPTSEIGKMTKSTPQGSIDYPINPLCIAIASECTFIARTVDSIPAHMGYILERAMKHKGTSFVEIYQNCLIFNDKTFEGVTGRDMRDDRMVYLEDGKPLLFGKEKEKAVRLNGLQPEVVNVKDVPWESLLIHRENDPNPHYAYLLTQMDDPQTPLPVPFGIFRAVEKPSYDEMMENQIQDAIRTKGPGDLQKLIYGPDTWTVR